MQNKLGSKGFTLIELLIVIAIIGILAVAFLPSLLNAPAKGRDSQRIANLGKLRDILIAGDIDGKAYPKTDSKGICVGAGFGGANESYYIENMGGAMFTDPQADNALPSGGPVTGCTGAYLYIQNPNTSPNPSAASGTYDFGLYAHTETFASANAQCKNAYSGVKLDPDESKPEDWCYAILSN